jgi:hypothetical protein
MNAFLFIFAVPTLLLIPLPVNSVQQYQATEATCKNRELNPAINTG